MTNDTNLAAMLSNKAIPLNPGKSIEVSDVEELPSWQHDTMSYTSAWRNGPAMTLTLRRYRGNLSYWQTQDPHQANRVWAVLRRLRLDGYPAPRPVARGEFGKSQYLIWRQPPGQAWNPDDFAGQTEALVPQLAGMLARLRALNHNGLNNEPLYQATVAGTLVRMLLWSREMGNDDLRRVIARLKPTVAQIRSWPHRLIHGDPRLDNVVVRDGQITALLNWENAAIGDPRWDVMTAAHQLHQRDAHLADELVNRYETFTGAAIGNRPFWYAMVAVRLWALKSWLYHAIQTQKVSSQHAAWTTDLFEVREKAFQYLAEAGL